MQPILSKICRLRSRILKILTQIDFFCKHNDNSLYNILSLLCIGHNFNLSLVNHKLAIVYIHNIYSLTHECTSVLNVTFLYCPFGENSNGEYSYVKIILYEKSQVRTPLACVWVFFLKKMGEKKLTFLYPFNNK